MDEAGAATGAAIGPWSGGWWNTVGAGTAGSNTGFFWTFDGSENMVVNLLSQGSHSDTDSLYDNLVIGADTVFAGDGNGDGDVDGDDMLIWQNNFPFPPSLLFVPEPNSLVLMTLGGLLMLRRCAI